MNIAPRMDSFADELRKIAKVKSKQERADEKIRRTQLGVATPALGIMAGHLFMGGNTDEKLDPTENHFRARKVQQGMGLMDTPTHVAIGDKGNNQAWMKSFENQPSMERSISTKAERHHSIPNADLYAQEGPSTKRYAVHVPRQAKESVTAHEFGHVANHSKWGKNFSRIGDLSRKLMDARVGGVRTHALPIITSGMAAGSDEPSWAPGAVNAAVAAPMLFDEAAASGRALKYMTKQHGVAKGLWKSKALAPAFGTYAALGLSPLAITGARKAWKKHKEKKAGLGMAGALMGGGLGMMVPGKYKAHAAIGGALVGGLAGTAAGGVSRAIHRDEHRLNALAAQQPTGDPNYVPTWQQGYR